MSPVDGGTGESGAFGRKLARLLRFAIFLCTSGWGFPHVCTEDMDLTAIQDRHTGGKRT